MPVDLAIVTGNRPLLEYLLQPLTDSFVHAFKEDWHRVSDDRKFGSDEACGTPCRLGAVRILYSSLGGT